jgi:DNA-binding NarL/FixJ family response regulator
VSGPVSPVRTVAGMDIVRITHLPTTSHPGVPRRGNDLTRRLNAEWDVLLADSVVRDELERSPIAGHRRLDALLAACGGDRSVDHETADGLLAQVVAAGLKGRTLAVRLVLQRALGSLVTIAVRRTRGQPGRRAALFDELCSTAWIVIGSYPLARRPRSVLANVVRDAEYLTCVRPQRLHDASHRVTLLDEHVPEVGLRGRRSEHVADELRDLVLGVGGPRGLVEGDLALLHALAAGQSVSAIAQALGCTDRTVRNRRRRLVTKLQQLSVADG